MMLPRISQVKTKTSYFGLDPRTTFTVACVLCLYAVISEGLLIFAVFSVLVILVAAGKLLRGWLHALRNISFLAVFLFVVKFLSLFVGSGCSIVNATFASAILMFKFLVIVQVFSFFYLSTSPDDFGLALQQSRVPFSACFALTLSMRFFPALSEETNSIADAQRSRGLELDKGNVLRRVKNFTAILIPLIINSIRRSVEIAEAMECRCYGLKRERTSLYSLTLKGRDFAVMLSSLVVVAITLWLILM